MNQDLCEENLIEDECNDTSILKLNDSNVRMPDVLYQNQETYNTQSSNWLLNESIGDTNHLVTNNAFASTESTPHN